MGCCTPEYRKVVLEQEEQVNQRGTDLIPFRVKAGICLITCGILTGAVLWWL